MHGSYDETLYTEVPCYSRRATIKIPPDSEVIGVEQRPELCSPSAGMVLKNLEQDEKHIYTSINHSHTALLQAATCRVIPSEHTTSNILKSTSLLLFINKEKIHTRPKMIYQKCNKDIGRVIVILA